MSTKHHDSIWISMFVAALGSAVVLASCGPSESTDPAVSDTFTVDGTGGTFTTTDGTITVDVPPGVAGGSGTLEITELTGTDRSVDLSSFGIDTTYRIKLPPGSTGMIEIVFNFTPAAPDPSGRKLPVLIPIVTMGSSAPGATLVFDPQGMVEIDDVGNAGIVRFQVDATVCEFGFADVSACICVHVDHPATLPVSQIDDVQVDVTVGPGTDSLFVAAGASWTTITSALSSIQFTTEAPTPYAGGNAIPPSASETDIRNVVCTTQGDGAFAVDLTLPLDGVSGAFPSASVTGIPAARLRYVGSIQCTGGGGGTQFLVFPSTSLTALESCRPVPANIPFAQTGNGVPSIIISGNGGAEVYDPTTGNRLEFYSYPGTTSFDCNILPGTNGATSIAGLLLTGVGFNSTIIDTATGDIAGLTQISGTPTFYKDQIPVADNVVNGVLLVTGNFITAANYDGTLTNFTNIASPQTIGVTFDTAVANTSLSDLLVIQRASSSPNVGTLVHVDRSQAPILTITPVGPTGTDPRRMRWDPTSGIGAFSNFQGDSITTFTWSGTGLPVFGQTIAVAGGPVDLDIDGLQIIVAGFNDDCLTLVTVDSSGMSTSVSTAALPTNVVSPGHVAFLDDVNGGCVVTGNTSNTICYIPSVDDFFP